MRIMLSSSTLSIIDAAGQWLIRNHAEWSRANDNRAFVNWLRESPVHVREYLAAELLWAEMEHLDFDKVGGPDWSTWQGDDNVVRLKTSV